MSYNLTTVTNAGNKLFNTIIDDNTRLVLDRIEVSATQLDSSTDLKSMTAIDSVVQTLPVNGVSKGDTSIIVKTVLDNKDIKTDYKAWVFGIWGHDEVANVDTLVGVITTTATPDTVPAFDPGSTIGLKYSFGIVYSNTAKIIIKQVNDQYAINDDVVHISGNESVTGTKTFQTIKIDNDSTKDVVTTDGYNISLDNGKTKFVPADDATVVHATEMRKPADKVASIDEVNAKADDSKVVHSADQAFKDKVNFSDIKFVQLEAGTDLLKLVNNTERTQYYACDTDAKAKQMINCPAQNAFALITYPISTTTPVNSNSYPASNYVRLMLFRYDNSETWTANINTASGLPTSNGWVQISMGDTSLTAGIYRGDLDVHTANLDSIRKAGTYGYGGTKLSWIGGPQSIQGLDRWGSLEVFGVGDTWIQRMTTNAAETFVRQQSGSPATWGAWYQLAKMDMNNNISVHDVLNQGFGEWMSVTQKRIAGGYGNLVTCPKGTDFGAFVKGNSVPVGFSMVRDSNTNVNVAVYKESSLYGWAWYQGTADVVSHQAYWSNGAWSGWKTRNEYIRASNESDAVAKSKADPNNLYYWV